VRKDKATGREEPTFKARGGKGGKGRGKLAPNPKTNFALVYTIAFNCLLLRVFMIYFLSDDNLDGSLVCFVFRRPK